MFKKAALVALSLTTVSFNSFAFTKSETILCKAMLNELKNQEVDQAISYNLMNQRMLLELLQKDQKQQKEPIAVLKTDFVKVGEEDILKAKGKYIISQAYSSIKVSNKIYDVIEEEYTKYLNQNKIHVLPTDNARVLGMREIILGNGKFGRSIDANTRKKITNYQELLEAPTREKILGIEEKDNTPTYHFGK